MVHSVAKALETDEIKLQLWQFQGLNSFKNLGFYIAKYNIRCNHIYKSLIWVVISLNKNKYYIMVKTT